MTSKKTYTLGICNDDTASACLLVNDTLLSAVSEERFSRKKYDNSFPKRSINWALKHANINLKRVNQIAYSWAKGFDKNLIPLYKKRTEQLKKKGKNQIKIFNERIKYEIKRDKKKLKEFKKWSENNLKKE